MTPTRPADGILRQQITDAVWRNLGARTSQRAVEATIDELVALLSWSAAEPPEIEALRSVVRKVFGPIDDRSPSLEAMRDGDLWWAYVEAIETTPAERAAIDAALAGVAAGPQATPDQDADRG